MDNKKNIKVKILEDSLLVGETLVLGDLHLGYGGEADPNVIQGVQLKETLEKLERIFGVLIKERKKLREIVIIGDLKQEFGGVNQSGWREILELLNYLKKKIKLFEGREIILIKGNHDNFLESIAKKEEIVVRRYYLKRGVCFLHGDEEEKILNNKPGLRVDTLIMGHMHPVLVLQDRYKKERYKCFLKGKWRKKNVYILPSFSPFGGGYDIRRIKGSKERGFVFIENKKLKNFEVFVYNPEEGKVYSFGRLKELAD